MNAANGLAEQARHRQHDDLLALGTVRGERNRVGDQQLVDRRLLDAVDRGAREHTVNGAGEHALGARVLQRLRGLLNGAGGVDDVVGNHAGAARDFTDHVHHLGGAVFAAALVDHGQFGVEALGIGARPFGTAGIGRDDGQLLVRLARQVIDDHRRGEEVIHRQVEETLDLRLVQVHAQHAIHARRGEHVGHQLRRDRHARLVLAVLPAVAVIRDHGGNAGRRRPAERIGHDHQLHQVGIHRGAGRLHDEDVGAANVFVDLERDFGVGKPAEACLSELHPEELGDLSRELRVSAA